MAAEGRLLEKSCYKLMILNFVYIFLSQSTPSLKTLHGFHRPFLTVRHFAERELTVSSSSIPGPADTYPGSV